MCRMAASSGLLQKIPDEYKPMAAVVIGARILVGIVLHHGYGLHRILLYNKRGERRLRVGPPNPVAVTFLFGWAVFLMLVPPERVTSTIRVHRGCSFPAFSSC